MNWEQRWHPFFEEWVVYSAHRNSRPWIGQTEKKEKSSSSFNTECYLCPGNSRVHGDKNPNYSAVYVFDNDHPVVSFNAPEIEKITTGMYQKKAAWGISKVICYDPRHNVTISDLTPEQVANIVMCWRELTLEMRKHSDICFAHFFENKGSIVGTSCPHPHAQLYASNFEFKNVQREREAAEHWKEKNKTNIFYELIQKEQENPVRVVAENETAFAFVPYFARFPYEVWMFPKKRHETLASFSDIECLDFARIYQEISVRYDLLFNMDFPYIFSIYQAPVDAGNYSDYHLHGVFLPPLRLPGVRKFPAGAELGGGNFMNDMMPEDAAKKLQAIMT